MSFRIFPVISPKSPEWIFLLVGHLSPSLYLSIIFFSPLIWKLGRRSWPRFHWWDISRETAFSVWWRLWSICCVGQARNPRRWWQWIGKWFCRSRGHNADGTSPSGNKLQSFFEAWRNYRVWHSYILWCLARKRKLRIFCWCGHGKKLLEYITFVGISVSFMTNFWYTLSTLNI